MYRYPFRFNTYVANEQSMEDRNVNREPRLFDDLRYVDHRVYHLNHRLSFLGASML